MSKTNIPAPEFKTVTRMHSYQLTFILVGMEKNKSKIFSSCKQMVRRIMLTILMSIFQDHNSSAAFHGTCESVVGYYNFFEAKFVIQFCVSLILFR